MTAPVAPGATYSTAAPDATDSTVAPGATYSTAAPDATDSTVAPGATDSTAALHATDSTVALDATYSTGRELSGVGLYSAHLMRTLARIHSANRFLYCYRSHKFFKSFRETLPPNASRRLLRSGSVPDASVFHALNQRVDAPGGGKNKTPVVVTFHDLFVMTGEYSTPEFRERFTQQARQAAARADRIIAVSAFTANQVHELLAYPRERIRVIHHGTVIPSSEPAGDSQRNNLVLHIGAIQKRKNLVRLIEAFEKASAPGWELILAGAGGFEAEQVLAIASRTKRKITITGYVSSDQLEQLYRRARIVAFPSLDEGFGIPVIEAMARGVPVLTSNRSALPEAAGGAALLVDPLDTDAIADGLSQLMKDPALRQHLRQRGLLRAANMTWDRAAEATWTVYQELM